MAKDQDLDLLRLIGYFNFNCLLESNGVRDLTNVNVRLLQIDNTVIGALSMMSIKVHQNYHDYHESLVHRQFQVRLQLEPQLVQVGLEPQPQ